VGRRGRRAGCRAERGADVRKPGGAALGAAQARGQRGGAARAVCGAADGAGARPAAQRVVAGADRLGGARQARHAVARARGVAVVQRAHRVHHRGAVPRVPRRARARRRGRRPRGHRRGRGRPVRLGGRAADVPDDGGAGAHPRHRPRDVRAGPGGVCAVDPAVAAARVCAGARRGRRRARVGGRGGANDCRHDPHDAGRRGAARAGGRRRRAGADPGGARAVLPARAAGRAARQRRRAAADAPAADAAVVRVPSAAGGDGPAGGPRAAAGGAPAVRGVPALPARRAQRARPAADGAARHGGAGADCAGRPGLADDGVRRPAAAGARLPGRPRRGRHRQELPDRVPAHVDRRRVVHAGRAHRAGAPGPPPARRRAVRVPPNAAHPRRLCRAARAPGPRP
ncbi:hypothetical protein IWQ57_006342, partial [Coemansia nantahalensis]